MKKSYVTTLNPAQVDIGLLIFRIGIAVLMLMHGIPKLITFFGPDPIQFGDPIGLGETTSLGLAVFAEFLCSILILIGFATRFAAIPLAITMLVAGLIIHMPDGMVRQELPLLYLTGYILLFFSGAGKYSLDHYFLTSKK